MNGGLKRIRLAEKRYVETIKTLKKKLELEWILKCIKNKTKKVEKSKEDYKDHNHQLQETKKVTNKWHKKKN